MTRSQHGNRPDQRQRYRVGIHRDMIVSLMRAEAWTTVRAVDLNCNGVGILLPGPEAARFLPGSVLSLRFALGGRKKVVVANARVVNSVQAIGRKEDLRHIGLAFTDKEGLHAQLDAGFWKYFNRRRDYRVTPEKPRPRVQLHWRDRELTGVLTNICMRGLAVAFPPSTQVLLLPGVDVAAAFQIPSTEDQLSLKGQVVHRVVKQGSPRIGIILDHPATPSSQEAQDQIHEFVMKRQRDELRKST